MERRHPDIKRRCRRLAAGKSGSGPVVYWMSREQRVNDNWALLRAQEEAIIHDRSLLVIFCLIENYPGANLRHYGFLLKGLAELNTTLTDLNIGFLLLEGDPAKQVPQIIRNIDAHSLTTDFDPLRIKQEWKKKIQKEIIVPFWEVDSHNIVPVWTASDKKEYGAYTIRPKINRLLEDYLSEIPTLTPLPATAALEYPPFNLSHYLDRIQDRTVAEIDWCAAGETAAQGAMNRILANRLQGYSQYSNNPVQNTQSELSPYLHFGQLSPQRLAWNVRDSDTIDEQDKHAFLEELIIRRELSDNFCYYEPSYDIPEGFPEWAQKTLETHRNDPRDYRYSMEDWENARTHDQLWNACQQDLIVRGKLHGYLRMYWAKKILEWSSSPEEAMSSAIFLNDRYSLDGRDPNGYTGIAWSIGGVHDRAWKERAVYGKIRYMNEQGCRRKFDVDRYIMSVNGANLPE